MAKVVEPRVDSRRPLSQGAINVRTTPAPLLISATIGPGTRHRPAPQVIVASALDYCYKLERELRQLGLRKEERRMFVRALVVNPNDPDAARLDATLDRPRAGEEEEHGGARTQQAESDSEAKLESVKAEAAEVGSILRAALNTEQSRVRDLQEQLVVAHQELARSLRGREYEEERAAAAEEVQRQLQDKLRKHRLAWDGRAKHAADTVSTMKRMAEMEEQSKGQQQTQLLGELDAAHQHVMRAEQAIAQCEQSKARMAESFAAMERELKDVRRQALAEQMQHEELARFLKTAKDNAEALAGQCREEAQQSREELDGVKGRFKQERSMKSLSEKSGARMRDDVQTNQLKCLDMEGKIARHAQQRQRLEDQLSDVKRNLATEVKARHALQRQIQGLSKDLARQQAKEKVLDEELSSFSAQTEDQELRLAAETRGRKFFQGLLSECETKLAAVLAGGLGSSGRWGAAGSLISNLLETSRTEEEEEISFERSLLKMSEFISVESSSTSIGGVAAEGDVSIQQQEQEPSAGAGGAAAAAVADDDAPTAAPRVASPVAPPREDPDLIVAMVLRNVIAAVEASG